MKILAHAFLALGLLTAAPACSVFMAADSDGRRDTGVLSEKVTRAAVLAELGEPIATVRDEPGIADDGVSQYYDIFRFTQERAGALNAGRAVFYGAAAVMTLGLSEVIATPLEGAVGEYEVRMRVFYDAGNRVTKSEVLKDNEWVPLR